MPLNVTLDYFVSLDLLRLAQVEPELEYLFRHAMIQETAYKSLLMADRRVIHQNVAESLRTLHSDHLEEIAPLLVHHYHFAENIEEECVFIRLAAIQAAARYANVEAVSYYQRLLPLLTAVQDQIEIHLQTGSVLEQMGSWGEAETHYRKALELSDAESAYRARCQFVLGKLFRQRGDHPEALDWLAKSQLGWARLQNLGGLAHTLIETGNVFFHKGDYDSARQQMQQGLSFARKVKDQPGIAQALNNLGNISDRQGDYEAAKEFHRESLAIRRELEDKVGISASLNNLGLVFHHQGDYEVARKVHEESLSLRREIGNKLGISASLNNLGNVAGSQGDLDSARNYFEEALALDRELGDNWGIVSSLANLGNVALGQGDYVTARLLHEECLSLTRELGNQQVIGFSLQNLGNVVFSQGDYSLGRKLLEESLAIWHEMGSKPRIVESLVSLARLAHREGVVITSVALLSAADALRIAIQYTLDSFERRIFDETINATRRELGEPLFNTTWAEGQAMTMEEAIALALSKPESKV